MERTMYWLYCLLLLFALLFIAGIYIYSDIQKKQIKKQQALPVTVWIHGTLFFPDYFLPKFFYCKPGLNLATELDESYHHNQIAQILAKADPKRFPLKTFYLFGWSGKLSFQARKKAAEDLYADLKKLITNYKKKYGFEPFIRIIAHSHGGNVALTLSKINNKNDLTICELILLACPVQERTKQYLEDPIFQQIISLYSAFDTIQVLDPQGLYSKDIHDMQDAYDKQKNIPWFSERIFAPTKRLIQAQIKIDGRNIFHIEFMLQKFLSLLPTILDQLEKRQNKKTIQEKPYSLSLKSR
ncbi:MAG: hypothetical protein WDZ41_00840 [Candidatus Babeliales bacterium]